MATFCFNCPQCSKQLEAEEDMRGLVVLCPHCEKGIVIPKVKSSSTQFTQLKKPQKSNFSTPQPEKTPQSNLIDPNFASIQRRLAEHENEIVHENELMQKMDLARRKQALISNIVWIVAGVLIVGVVLLGWNIWRNSKEREAAIVMERMKLEEARRVADAERFKAEQEKRKLEHEKKMEEWEKKQAENRKRRAEKAAALKKQQEEEARLLNERRAAEAAKEKVLKERSQKFRSIVKSLSGMRAEMWRNLPKDNRPGRFDGVFHVIVSNLDYGETIYEVESKSDGFVKAIIILSNGETNSVELADYEKDVIRNGGLVLLNDCAYIVSPKRSSGNLFPLPKNYECPAEMVLGESLFRFIRYSRIDMTGISFSVSYIGQGSKREIPIKEFSFNLNIRRSDILNTLVQHEFRSFNSRMTAKRNRRTVVFYDGALLKRGMDGVTYVPRDPKNNFAHNYWELRREAIRQEEEMNERKERMADAEMEARSKVSQNIASSMDRGRLKIVMISNTYR